MKEAKLEPIAKLTETQLNKLRGIVAQIELVANATEHAFHKRQEFMDEVRKAYGLTIVEFYVDPRTGEIFEIWPKV